jgi:hypothetical protein
VPSAPRQPFIAGIERSLAAEVFGPAPITTIRTALGESAAA